MRPFRLPDTLIGARFRFANDRGGKDRLFGDPGDETLQGGEGNDLLESGLGEFVHAIAALS
ncbi:hypothetical protein [Novipirellula artificiosorum]|uniref:hypothetical protein n=1 Tax=Novipirellula artificiosorum TaxID=2528016 RepID=UPI0011B509E1|nr:hypothetical protein [Novipirellula artificiosorum]